MQRPRLAGPIGHSSGSPKYEKIPSRWDFFVLCLYCTKSEPIFKIVITSVPRALKRHHAKRGASAEAEVRGNALHSATMFWGQRRRSAEMRNASEILRNAGGLGESISQNSLRVLPDFLAGFWRAGIKNSKYITLKSRQSRDNKINLCLTHPPTFAHKIAP